MLYHILHCLNSLSERTVQPVLANLFAKLLIIPRFFVNLQPYLGKFMNNRMTEKEKMLAGEVYSAVDPELIEELMATREVLYEYNSLRPSETLRMKEILKGLLGHAADDEFLINQPFHCDYGKQISIGKRFFANFNFTVLDEASVTIGDDCFIGPNVSIYTACHSNDPVERNSRQ